RSAVATPTRAVAAANSRSARRTSGRRRSSSDGSPTGTAGGGGGIGLSADRSFVSASGSWPSSTPSRRIAWRMALCSSRIVAAAAKSPEYVHLPGGVEPELPQVEVGREQGAQVGRGHRRRRRPGATRRTVAAGNRRRAADRGAGAGGEARLGTARAAGRRERD